MQPPKFLWMTVTYRYNDHSTPQKSCSHLSCQISWHGIALKSNLSLSLSRHAHAFCRKYCRRLVYFVTTVVPHTHADPTSAWLTWQKVWYLSLSNTAASSFANTGGGIASIEAQHFSNRHTRGPNVHTGQRQYPVVSWNILLLQAFHMG